MAFQRPDPAGICFCAGATAFAQRFAQRLVQRALQRVAEDLATGPVKLRGFGDDSVGSCLAGSRWISLDLAGSRWARCTWYWGKGDWDILGS